MATNMSEPTANTTITKINPNTSNVLTTSVFTIETFNPSQMRWNR